MEFIEAGFLTNAADLMPLLGVDESLWLVEHDGKEEEHSLQNEGFKVNCEEFASTFEDDETFFDDGWMTTKIDFSNDYDGVFLEDLIANESVETLPSEASNNIDISDTVVDESANEVEFLDNTIGENSSVLSPNVDESILEDSPVSPEQYVPSAETQNIKDLISMLCSGQCAIDKPKLCPSLMTLVGKISAAFPNAPNTGIPPETAQNIDIEQLLHKSISTAQQQSEQPMTPTRKQSFKMKRRTPEQKEKKRLQNRNAATRYRSKKRSEQDVLNDQCQNLEAENKTLREAIENLQHETEYLKNVIIDVCQKK